MKKYNKLVRDYIPDIIRGKGRRVVIKEIGKNADRKKWLVKKLKEEVREYLAATQEYDELEELADILEVIYALAELRNMRPAQKLEAIRKTKAQDKGAFKRGVILVSVE